MKASTETRTFSTQKHHEKKTNFFYSTNCKRLLSLVLTLDCMSLPMMPLSLLPEDAILHSTIVDILNFQPFLFSTLGFTGNCIFKVLAIAKFWQCVSRADKLNGYTKRKTEYFSFSKHSFRLKVKMAVEPVIGHCSVCGIFSHLILIITGDAIGVVVTNYGEYIVTN